MPKVCPWLLPWVILGTLCGDLEAQSAQPFSLQASGLVNGVFGNVFGGLQDGIGGEAQFRYTPGALSVGAGFQFTIHQIRPQSQGARLYGGFIEPRYRIHAGSNVVAPYVSGRFSLLKVGFSEGDLLSLSSIFMQLNGGGGLLIRLGSRLNLDFGATFGYNRLGSGTRTSRSAGTEPVESSSGSNIVVRLGLAIGLRD